MPFWKPSSVDNEPVTYLESWQVWNVDGQLHVSGCPSRGEGRVSSALTLVPGKTGEFISASGRRYVLMGDSYEDSDASYVWGGWLRVNNPASVINVSAAFKADKS